MEKSSSADKPMIKLSNRGLMVRLGSRSIEPIDASRSKLDINNEPTEVKHIIRQALQVSLDRSISTTIFNSIQSAVNKAPDHAIIKIEEGVYVENIVIKNKNLKLEPKDSHSEVFIVGENGAAVRINNSKGEIVVLERIKMIHRGGYPIKQRNKRGIIPESLTDLTNSKLGASSGKNFQNTSIDSLPQVGESPEAAVETQTSLGGRKQTINLTQATSLTKQSIHTASEMPAVGEAKRTLEAYMNEVIYALPNDSEGINCGILVENGCAQLRNCKINMNFIVKLKKGLTPFVPAVLARNNSTVLMSFCDLRGSSIWDTVGIVSQKASIAIRDCNVTHFSLGGVAALISEENTVKIIHSRIMFNKGFGVQLMGRSSVANEYIDERVSYKDSSNLVRSEIREREIIKGCTIEKNDGPGIQICIPNTALVTQNTVMFNKNGIEVVSADPRIVDNTISKNKMNGILVRAMSSMQAAPSIRGNTIRSNRENGILCIGYGNKARIIANLEIALNRLCGVRVQEQAAPIINMNRIFRNLFQGVLIVENSSAHIEKNKIKENIKANIAFGGDASADTVIKNNIIANGRCEGIFMIEAGCAYVQNNKISRNYDGVIMVTSCPEMSSNTISGNKNSGVIVMKDSRPKIYKNQILSNGNVGLYIRDNCRFDRGSQGESAFSVQDSSDQNFRTDTRADTETTELQRHPGLFRPSPKKSRSVQIYEPGTEKGFKELGLKRLAFVCYDNIIADSPVGLVVERPISDGEQILAMNDIRDCEFRIPYTCKDTKCVLI